MKHIFASLILALISFSGFSQSYNLADPIPMDPAIHTGVLGNGMTYYIRHNENPKARASFYICQNVGALLEDDKQNGLAHFLEHMAFNGTKHFPGKNLLNVLEQNGVKFGKDVNAYTTKNETVYNMSNVPVANNNLVDTCLLILSDWSHNLSLTTEEINAERGVISEEWRTRRNSQFRIQQKLAPALFNGSKYAERDVIGNLDVIKNFDPAEIRAFYHDWYRTDLQAIAIVGDVDVDQVEAKVKSLFSAIPAVENPKARPFTEIPDNEKPLFTVVTDKDSKSASVSLVVRRLEKVHNTLGNVRDGYLQACFNNLIAARLKEIVQKGNVPYTGGNIKIASMERGYPALSINAGAKNGEEAAAFEGVYSELHRVIQHGFTQTEFDRVISKMLANLDNSYKQRDLVANDAYCNSLKTAFLNQSGLAEAEFSYKIIGEMIRSFTLDEVGSLASKWLSPNNRVYYIVGPVSWKHLTEDQLLAVVNKVEKANLEKYIDVVPEGELLDGFEPEGGEIVSEKRNKLFGDVEWTLSNGTKVIFKPVKNDTEIVALSGYSTGGASLYSAKDLPNVVNVPDFVNTYGIGNYNSTGYKKIMSGNTAACVIGIDSYEEEISASAAAKDLETMFQLVFMRFENPRFDRDVYEKRMKENYDRLKQNGGKSTSIMKDTLESILMNSHPRMRRFGKSYLEDMSFERMEEIYRERFADASDFTFILVGNSDEESIKPLVAKYLGSIKDIDRKENWVDHHVDFPKGKQQKDIVIPMSSYKSSVVLRYNTDADFSRKNVIYQSILGSILTLRFTEIIREKEGGTYGVQVKPGVARLPKGQMSMAINFDCDPEKAKYLRSLVFKELENIQKNVTQEDLNKVVLNLKKNKEQTREDVKYWMGVLGSYYKYQENKLDPAYFDELVNKVTSADIEKAARKFFKKADVVDVIFYPKQEKSTFE
jgi:zinc protease